VPRIWLHPPPPASVANRPELDCSAGVDGRGGAERDVDAKHAEAGRSSGLPRLAHEASGPRATWHLNPLVVDESSRHWLILLLFHVLLNLLPSLGSGIVGCIGLGVGGSSSGNGGGAERRLEQPWVEMVGPVELNDAACQRVRTQLLDQLCNWH
jgi:hypothetical protein